MVYPILECALEVREALCTTPESHLLAEVVATFPADTTLSARDTDFQCNSISKLEASHLGADGDNSAGGLMAKRQRLAGAEVAIREFLVVGDVRAANSRGPDGNLQLANSRVLNAPHLLYAKLAVSPGRIFPEAALLPSSMLLPKIEGVQMEEKDGSGSLCNGEIWGFNSPIVGPVVHARQTH